MWTDLEKEPDVVGFLGVHIETNQMDNAIKLTQKELTQRICNALPNNSLSPTKTPATARPLHQERDVEICKRYRYGTISERSFSLRHLLCRFRVLSLYSQ
jgi:hypothetical protein